MEFTVVLNVKRRKKMEGVILNDEIEVLQVSVVYRPKKGNVKVDPRFADKVAVGSYEDINISFIVKPSPGVGLEVHFVANQKSDKLLLPHHEVIGFSPNNVIRAVKRFFGMLVEDIKDEEFEKKQKEIKMPFSDNGGDGDDNEV